MFTTWCRKEEKARPKWKTWERVERVFIVTCRRNVLEMKAKFCFLEKAPFSPFTKYECVGLFPLCSPCLPLSGPLLPVPPLSALPPSLPQEDEPHIGLSFLLRLASLFLCRGLACNQCPLFHSPALLNTPSKPPNREGKGVCKFDNFMFSFPWCIPLSLSIGNECLFVFARHIGRRGGVLCLCVVFVFVWRGGGGECVCVCVRLKRRRGRVCLCLCSSEEEEGESVL